MPETTSGSPGGGSGTTALEGRVLLLAHRGGRGPWRENTLEAFLGALEQGADGVELDVRRTRDGTLVVHHDAVVPGLGRLHELGRDELPTWMPTLEEALTACEDAFVNVEIKGSPREPGHVADEAVAAQVLRVVADTGAGRPGAAHSGLLISSFSEATITALGSSGDDVALGLLVEPSRSAYEALDQAHTLGCRTLNVFHLQVTPDLVSRARRAGMGVVAWTVNGPHEVSSMLDAGVEAIITDDVLGALSVIGAGGSPPVPGGAS